MPFGRSSRSVCVLLQERGSRPEDLARLHDSLAASADALGRLAAQELRGAQAEVLEEEAAAQVWLCGVGGSGNVCHCAWL